MSTVHAVPKEELPHLDRPERKYVATLRERLDYLEGKYAAAVHGGTHLEGAAPYWKSEIRALHWALDLIEKPAAA